MTPPLKAARVPADALPVIEIGGWYDGDADARRQTAQAVLRACREIGFLYVKGHPVPQAVVSDTFEAARTFFALPEAAKQAVHYRNAAFRRGYIPLLAENSDPLAKGDLKEAFDFGVEPLGGPAPVLANQWPSQPAGFRLAVESYLTAARSLAGDLLAMIALGLGLPEDWFAPKMTAPIATMRLLRYPPQPPPTSGQVLGIGAHCDYECLTVLAQGEVGGLQVRAAGGGWIEAPPVPGAFVVNVGEMLARWTNDDLVATEHRVINLSGAERFSIPVFFATNPEVMIEPLPVCVSPDRPARYAPIRADHYLDGRIEEIYGNGQAQAD